jgi:hypothetical protein
VLETADELEAHVPAWETLAREAVEPNVFQESWMLLPAWRAFGIRAPLRAVLVFGAANQLNGLFLLERVPRFYGLPITRLRTWTHLQSALGTPLIRASAALETLEAFFDWLARDQQGAGILELFEYGTGGAFDRALTACVERRGLRTFVPFTFDRALLRRGPDAARTLAEVMSSGNRKELRRQRRRLDETGRVEVRELQAGEDPSGWLDQFLSLERSGWKGREQSALGSDPVSREYFDRIARAAHARGRLMLLGLFLDGRAIAMKCNFLAAPGAFSFKIAFDEALARFSPGVQLELEHVRIMHARPDLDWMDSCTRGRHFMIERLWPGRRGIATTLIATGRSRGATSFVSSLPVLSTLYRATRPIRRLFRTR